MIESFRPIFQNALSLELVAVTVRELFFFKEAPCNFYALKHNQYKIVLQEFTPLSKNSIRYLIENQLVHLYCRETDYELVKNSLKDSLRNITRSLSIGDPLQNVVNLINILSVTLKHLYTNTTDDELLKLQYQSIKILAQFLVNNNKLHPKIVSEYQKLKHHFMFSQPMLSSIFLIGSLKQTHLLSPKEIENLFITSYFKDIGMSIIPIKKYEDYNLSNYDKVMISKHTEFSIKILSNRISLPVSHLEIIKNHHSFSLMNSHIETFEKDDIDYKVISGFETMIVNIMDIIAAMISGRPFREATSVFDALELVKHLIADKYPQEFKIIVHYFQQFFSIKKKKNNR